MRVSVCVVERPHKGVSGEGVVCPQQQGLHRAGSVIGDPSEPGASGNGVACEQGASSVPACTDAGRFKFVFYAKSLLGHFLF